MDDEVGGWTCDPAFQGPVAGRGAPTFVLHRGARLPPQRLVRFVATLAVLDPVAPLAL